MQNRSIENIKSSLLSHLDNENNVLNVQGVLDAITHLDNYPITKEILEQTRLGKFVNELRKKTTDKELSKKAKDLVKKWQIVVNQSSISPTLVIPPQPGSQSRIQSIKSNLPGNHFLSQPGSQTCIQQSKNVLSSQQGIKSGSQLKNITIPPSRSATNLVNVRHSKNVPSLSTNPSSRVEGCTDNLEQSVVSQESINGQLSRSKTLENIFIGVGKDLANTNFNVIGNNTNSNFDMNDNVKNNNSNIKNKNSINYIKNNINSNSCSSFINNNVKNKMNNVTGNFNKTNSNIDLSSNYNCKINDNNNNINKVIQINDFNNENCQFNIVPKCNIKIDTFSKFDDSLLEVTHGLKKSKSSSVINNNLSPTLPCSLQPIDNKLKISPNSTTSLSILNQEVFSKNGLSKVLNGSLSKIFSKSSLIVSSLYSSVQCSSPSLFSSTFSTISTIQTHIFNSSVSPVLTSRKLLTTNNYDVKNINKNNINENEQYNNLNNKINNSFINDSNEILNKINANNNLNNNKYINNNSQIKRDNEESSLVKTNDININPMNVINGNIINSRMISNSPSTAYLTSLKKRSNKNEFMPSENDNDEENVNTKINHNSMSSIATSTTANLLSASNFKRARTSNYQHESSPTIFNPSGIVNSVHSSIKTSSNFISRSKPSTPVMVRNGLVHTDQHVYSAYKSTVTNKKLLTSDGDSSSAVNNKQDDKKSPFTSIGTSSTKKNCSSSSFLHGASNGSNLSNDFLSKTTSNINKNFGEFNFSNSGSGKLYKGRKVETTVQLLQKLHSNGDLRLVASPTICKIANNEIQRESSDDDLQISVVPVGAMPRPHKKRRQSLLAEKNYSAENFIKKSDLSGIKNEMVHKYLQSSLNHNNNNIYGINNNSNSSFNSSLVENISCLSNDGSDFLNNNINNFGNIGSHQIAKINNSNNNNKRNFDMISEKNINSNVKNKKSISKLNNNNNKTSNSSNFTDNYDNNNIELKQKAKNFLKNLPICDYDTSNTNYESKRRSRSSFLNVDPMDLGKDLRNKDNLKELSISVRQLDPKDLNPLSQEYKQALLANPWSFLPDINDFIIGDDDHNFDSNDIMNDNFQSDISNDKMTTELIFSKVNLDKINSTSPMDVHDNKDNNMNVLVNKALNDKWPGVNGSYDFKNDWQPWTKTFSMKTCHNNYLHIMPYVSLDF